ncbi:MAG: hypothetical protein JEZ09_17390 [Salinivirgaceae bacterium]|nr:hypothetical protein [Salinivirgaceae bacterium]
MNFIEVLKQWMLVFIVLTLTSFSLFSQEKTNKTVAELYSEFDSKYGLDYNLYKGTKYYNSHSYKYGHPFWKHKNSIIGKVELNGKIYDSINLKYDIYLDELVLDYTTNIGANSQIILNSAIVDNFWIGIDEFVKNNDRNIEYDFFHLIYKGQFSCYFTYKKEYKYFKSSSKDGFGYDEEKISKLIVFDGQNHVFKSKKDLLKLLPEEIRLKVKSKIKQNNYKLLRSNQYQLEELFNYINTLLIENNE